jgi:prolipoprotein diacylglyceryl transferase
VIAFIPSPDRGTIDLGPFVIHMYGLMLLVAIAACVALTGVRYVRRGGDWDLVLRVAVWGVAAGIVGARLYHDITSWDEVPHTWWGPFAVWQGGLGIWGGITCGVLAGAIVVKRAGASVTLMMDCVAPGLLLAQAIGRWGNYFNQELFGEPTDLPWGLEIDPARRPPEFADSETFHPTFLYEFGWNVIGVLVLLLVDRRFRIKPPGLFALYVAWYTFGRMFEELIRIDPSHEYLGFRLNFYVSATLFVLAVIWFVWAQRRPVEGDPPKRRPRPVPEGPKMTVPKKRIRPGR